ncbi:MAG: T9SS type A sorting domain-containing protein [Bacteroidia bacterium]|nr:T9SS type A sorting domain-containing protein [Bacteroidia bacterium]
MRRLFTIMVVVGLMSVVIPSSGQVTDNITAYASQNQEIGKVVQIYPSPATDYVNIKFETLLAKNIKLTVHNIIGNEMNVETEVVSDHELRVRVKDLASGYYLLAIKEEEAKYRGTFKILKR